MLNFTNWELYDKHGSPVNWTALPLYELSFESDIINNQNRNGVGYINTTINPDNYNIIITNPGIFYSDKNIRVYLTTTINDLNINRLDITEYLNISTNNISVFNPVETLVHELSDVTITNTNYFNNLFKTFIYPSVTYSGAIYLKPVSNKLFETEHIMFFENINNKLYNLIVDIGDTISFRMVGLENEINLFDVNETESIINIVDEIIINTNNILEENVATTTNICFSADDEGVYERKLRIYHVNNEIYYPIAELIINAESIGQDERLDTIETNFGLPHAKDLVHLFKESDINEELVDYEISNAKSKLMVINHDQIIPYLGTYKALINAVKWLGYDDIYFREWFKNVKENRKLSLIVPFDAKDRTKTILKYSADERKAYKKLNELSMVYLINKETGEYDKNNLPITENNYSFNLEEVFIKLYSIKKWLEEEIIGVNARIIDITGEGVYFEQFRNIIYGTHNQEFAYIDTQTISPKLINAFGEIVSGETYSYLTLAELTETTIETLAYNKFTDFIDYVYNVNDGSTTNLFDDEYQNDPDSYLEVGPPLSHPLVSLRDIQWEASENITESFAINYPFTDKDKGIWIYENTIRMFNWYNESSKFNTKYTIDIYDGYIRKPSGTGLDWNNDAIYKISSNNIIKQEKNTIVSYNLETICTIKQGFGTLFIGNDTIEFNIPIDNTDINQYVSFYSSNNIVNTISSNNSEIIIECERNINFLLEDVLTKEITSFSYGVSIASPINDDNSTFSFGKDNIYRENLLALKTIDDIDYEKGFYIQTDDDNDIKLYGDNFLDIQYGKISFVNYNEIDKIETIYNIIFNKDEYGNLTITGNVKYTSNRMPLFVIDPKIYYESDTINRTGGDNINNYIIDNSIHNLKLHHVGDYNITCYGFDYFNNAFLNISPYNFNAYIKSPTITNILFDNKEASTVGLIPETTMNNRDINNLFIDNKMPVYDRYTKFDEVYNYIDNNGDTCIKAEDISYFQTIPDNGNILKGYNCNNEILNIYYLNNILESTDELLGGYGFLELECLNLYGYNTQSNKLNIVLFNEGSYNKYDEYVSYDNINKISYTIDIVDIDFSNNIITVYLDLDRFKSLFNIYKFNSDHVYNLYVIDNSIYDVTLNDDSINIIDNTIDSDFVINNMNQKNVNLLYVADSERKKYEYIPYMYGGTHTIENTDYTTNEISFIRKFGLPLLGSSDYLYKIKSQNDKYVEYYFETNYSYLDENNLLIYTNSYLKYFFDRTFVILETDFDMRISNDIFKNSNINLSETNEELNKKSWYIYNDNIYINSNTINYYDLYKTVVITGTFENIPSSLISTYADTKAYYDDGFDKQIIATYNNKYMLDEQTFIVIRKNDDKSLYARYYNPHIAVSFTEKGSFDAALVKYDFYGNMSFDYREGYINVV